MKQIIRLGGIASAFCIVTMAQLPGVAFAQAGSAAEAGWTKMIRCAAIGDDKARHSCTDDALREAGLLTDETKATAKRKAFGLQKPVPAPAIARAPAPAPAPAQGAAVAPPEKVANPTPTQPGKESSEQLEVTLAKVEQAGGKIVLTTTDGAVWQQVESDSIRQLPVQGQVMKIEAGSLGGFLCHSSKYVWFRCYRSR